MANMGHMTTGIPNGTAPAPSLTYFAGPEPRMRLWASYQFLFGSPNKWMNLLLAGVCVLIPIVGMMVLIGWLIEILVPRVREDWPGWEGPAPYPDFDFGRFSPYLTRGLWPFLVSFVAGFVVMIPLYLVLGLVVLGAVSVRSNSTLVTAIFVLGALLFFAAMVGLMLVMTPLMIRAALVQDFGQSFSLQWTKDFIALTWREMVLETLFSWVTSIPLVILGYLLCFVGLYPAMALMLAAQWHLNFQLYRLYLARGGAAIAPKGFPPPLPAYNAGHDPHP
jgi:hypothetical protein